MRVPEGRIGQTVPEMTSQALHALLDALEDTREIVVRRSAPEPDLVAAHEDARDEAREAFADWARAGGRELYARWVAAADRADAAAAVLVV